MTKRLPEGWIPVVTSIAYGMAPALALIPGQSIPSPATAVCRVRDFVSGCRAVTR